MRNLLFTLCLGILFSTQAQQTATNKIDTQNSRPTEWTVYNQDSDYKIEYKFTDCDPKMGYDKEVVLLKVTNLSSSKILISWNSELEYDGNCNTCNYPDEYYTEFSIGAGQIIQADCDLYADTRFRFFSKFIDVNYTQGVKMTAFKLNNLTINKQ